MVWRHLEICVPWLEVIRTIWFNVSSELIAIQAHYFDLSFTVLKTICSSLQPCTPEDGHNGARNMLSYWFINKS